MKKLIIFIVVASLTGFCAWYGCGGSSTSSTTTTTGWTTVTASGAFIVEPSLFTGGAASGISGYFDLTYNPSDTTNMWFVGNGGEVAKSTTSGASASLVTFPSSSRLRAVIQTDNNNVWVGGNDSVNGGASVWKTTNSGTTWSVQKNTLATKTTSVPSTDRINMILCLSDGLTCSLVGGYSDNTSLIWNTINGGTTWTQVYNTATTGTDDELNAVFFGSNGSAIAGIAVGNTGAILVVTPSSIWTSATTWTVATSGTTSTLYDIECFSSTTCLVVGAGGTILKTTNGGTTWTAKTSGTTEDLNGLDIVGTSKAWAGGSNGKILYSSDAGETWTAQTTDMTIPYPIQEIIMISETTGFAACANTSSNTGAVLKTTTGGQ